MSTPSPSANIARHLAAMAAARPTGVALKIPRGRTPAGDIDYLALTFADLDAEVSAWCARLALADISRGDRTLVMVRPGLPLIASVFALFRLGAVPVIADPGMGLKSFLACVARSRPRALLGIPSAQLVSRLFRPSFRSVTVRVPVSAALTARLTASRGYERYRSDVALRVSAGMADPSSTLRSRAEPQEDNARIYEAEVGPTDLAAILFTSGSTGAPKGVCYEHGMFEAQVRSIRELYDIRPGEIDLPLLPIFALFNPALGMTTIVPELDPRRPADLDPEKIARAIRQEGVTNSFGSPTLWRKIAAHCLAHNLALPTLRRVLCAGAPVPAELWTNARRLLSEGKLHSPYGATEALPVASVSADEIEPASVRGACVGRVAPEMEVRIIAVTDQPIASLAAAREIPRGEIGEIIVRGPVVTKEYDAQPDATAAAKIPDGASVWHRMGDCGYVDEKGLLWFCGRKAERVETPPGVLHTEPCEQVFRAHPRVTRCALIGLGARPQQRAALVVEGAFASSDAIAFAGELKELAQRHEHTRAIKTFFFHPRFPVDVRHNAKIHRLHLAKWAATAKAYGV